MLDITLFRDEKTAELIKQSEKKRFAKNNNVDLVIKLDTDWRKLKHKHDNINKQNNLIKLALKDKNQKKIFSGKEDLDKNYDLYEFTQDEIKDLSIKQLNKLKLLVETETEKIKSETVNLELERNKALFGIGNIVHSNCPFSDDEDDNKIINTYGICKEESLKHHEIMEKLGLNTKAGGKTFGARGYYLIGDLVLLNNALIAYSLDFLINKGFEPVYPPVMMNKETMKKCSQLEEFDEVLYKVTDNDENNEKYLIATSEQPLTALHQDENLKDLPIKYCGVSECFRKEAGSHKDQNGIFRVHQFTKIEQFCITKPDESMKVFDAMIKNCEEFYQSLKIPYRVVSIVSGKLNNSAALKYDLEAWFPASKAFRELVSCSNCTDYQSRRLNIKHNNKYVHMLNATLCATTRTMCCIVESYQTKDGVIVPDVLKKYINKDFLKYKY